MKQLPFGPCPPETSLPFLANHSIMLALKIVKPFVKQLVQPWVLVFIVIRILQIFYSSWALTFASMGALLYGATRRRKNYTYYPAKPEWYIHCLDFVLDSLIMYHESISSALKMFRMALPFLGQYEWISRQDPRITGKPSFSIQQFLQTRPSIQMSDPSKLTQLPAFSIDPNIDFDVRERSDDEESDADIGEHPLHLSESEVKMTASHLTELVETEDDFVSKTRVVNDSIHELQDLLADSKKDQ